VSLDEVHQRAFVRNDSSSFLPDPTQRDRKYAIVSVDDHLLEPSTLFEGRLPAKLADRAPRFITRDDGANSWVLDGVEHPISMMNAPAGRPKSEWVFGPINYDEVRRGAWDVDERIADMDLAGVYASLGFPSMTWGFAGQRLSSLEDPELGLACVRAYNDWVVDEWTAAHPDRIIPCQIPWFPDIDEAVAEVHRNAARGVHALAFTENPEMIGYPSLHTGHWDPLFAACQETGTVLNLHVGSASWTPIPSSDSPMECVTTLFAVTSLLAVTDWLWSFVPLRFPDLRIVLSEGGIGWVPMIRDRLVHMRRSPETLKSWPKDAPVPDEVLFRNFRFASYFDPSVWGVIAEIGPDAVVVEVDYPHADSTWPDSQAVLDLQIGDLDPAVIRKVTYANACELYQHPLPPDGWALHTGPAPAEAGSLAS
jgi:predicted TIM-barrel fold metal-dependent hydrolase